MKYKWVNSTVQYLFQTKIYFFALFVFLFDRNLNKKTNFSFDYCLFRSNRLSLICYFDLLKKVNFINFFLNLL